MITAANGRLAERPHGPGLRPFRKEHALPVTPKDPSLVQPSQKFPAVGIDPIPREPARRRTILHIDRLHITIEVRHGVSMLVPKFSCHRSAPAAVGLSWVVFGRLYVFFPRYPLPLVVIRMFLLVVFFMFLTRVFRPHFIMVLVGLGRIESNRHMRTQHDVLRHVCPRTP